MSTKEVIAPGELAVELTSDISGGLGVHKSGTKLRNLSESTFTTLTAGFGKAIPEGTALASAEDVSEPVTKAPVGTKKE
jgi:hypothetical protein